jgi:hypothetical protein
VASAKTKTRRRIGGRTLQPGGRQRRAQHLATIDLERIKAASFKDNGCFSTFGARLLCLTLRETKCFVRRGKKGYFGKVRALPAKGNLFLDNLPLGFPAHACCFKI